jgi:hypothetical protein
MKYTGVLFVVLIYSCANIVMPTGGTKDLNPPKLESSVPLNNSIKFSGNEISLKFDEFVELESPQKNIFISPYTKQIPEFYIQGKKVYIHFPDGLKSNTTYSVHFNKAIKDYTEGNILQDFLLNFSTGIVLDSGKYSTIATTIKDKKTSDLTIVALVKNKYDFFGRNYNYISNTKNGQASFNNLNNDLYYSYAFIDSNQNLKWDKNELVAFANQKIKQGQKGEKLILFPNHDTSSHLIVTSKSKQEYDIYSLQEIITIDCLDPNVTIYYQNPYSFKIIAKHLTEGKSINIRVNNNKYIDIKLPISETKKTIELIDKEDARLSQLKRNDSCTFSFNAFISRVDTSKLKLKQGDKVVKPQFYINKNQLVLTGLDFGKTYSIEIDSQAIWVQTIYNKKISYTFSTFSKENYFSELDIKIDTSLLNIKPIIYAFQNGKFTKMDLIQNVKLQNVFGSELIIHIVIDENKNGQWDTGDIERDAQPEPYHIETIKLDQKTKEYILKITNP